MSAPRGWTIYRVRVDLAKVRPDPPKANDPDGVEPCVLTVRRRGLIQQRHGWWQADDRSLPRMEAEAIAEVVKLGTLTRRSWE